MTDPHHIQPELDAIRAEARWRSLTPRETTDPTSNFSTNDYLNLADDPRLKRAAQSAIEIHGCGATASRLMAGHLPIHQRLEAALADLTQQPTALAFPSGYQTNLAVITALANRQDLIFSDALNHASLIDGIRLSRANTIVYRHNDLDHLTAQLATAPHARRKLIVSESLFSMDGDRADVAALRRLADRYNALLIIDEAHALGIFGNGGGCCVEANVRPDITIGTLGKALGSGGGFAACGGQLRDLLINTARPFIFSTGLAPPLAAAALEALDIVQSENGRLGATLLERARAFANRLRALGVEVPDGFTQIVPIQLGASAAAVAVAETLCAEGITVSAIRPPTVPPGTSRLRLSVTLAHDASTLEDVANKIAHALRTQSATVES